MMKLSATLVVAGLLIAAVLSGGMVRAAEPLLPADDSDIAALSPSVLSGNYCEGVRLQPYLTASSRYLTAMREWLALALADEHAHLEALRNEQHIAADYAARVQWYIDASNVAVLIAQLSADFTSATGAITRLQTALSPPEGDAAASTTQQAVAALVALAKVESGRKHLLEAARRTQGEAPNTSVFSLQGKELADRIQSDMPGAVHSLQDLGEDIAKAKDQIVILQTANSILNAESVAGATKAIVRVGTAMAKFSQGRLLREIQDMKESAASVDPVLVSATRDYDRLVARDLAAKTALGRLAAAKFGTVHCMTPCVPDPGAPTGMAFGGQAYPAQGITYGTALPTFGVATTDRYASAIERAHNTNVTERDNPNIVLTAKRAHYLPGEKVPYLVHAGKTCFPVFVRANNSADRGAHILNGGPFSGDVNGQFAPDTNGDWRGRLYEKSDKGNAEAQIQTFRFQVVARDQKLFNGFWDTIYGTLILHVSDTGVVTASWWHDVTTADWAPNIDSATVSGDVMNGRWSNSFNKSVGTFEFHLLDVDHFEGGWKLEKGGGGSVGPWAGARHFPYNP
jgi:hypothetical protein